MNAPPPGPATAPTAEALRARLAVLRGIGVAYHDYRGELRTFSPVTRDALLVAMGVQLNDPVSLQQEIDALDSARWRSMLPSVVVLRPGRMGVPIALPAAALDRGLAYRVRLEHGGTVDGAVSAGALEEGERKRGQVYFQPDGDHGNASAAEDKPVPFSAVSRRLLVLPETLPPGYHLLRVELDGGVTAQCALVVSPGRCFEPAPLQAGERLWGIAVQLYTLRSERNWGVGDFADLGELVALAAACGADFVGVNPLHALFTANPVHASPYSPSSRMFLNTLCIAVTDLPEYFACATLCAEVESAGFQRQLEALRAKALVDYAGVSHLKLPALERLYLHFREHHMALGTERARAFREYRRSRGEPLRRFALHEAIDRRMRARDPGCWGWPAWPEGLRDPEHADVIAFEAAHAEEVAFHEWLQWTAEEQLAAVQARARGLGMKIGIYGDYAVGVNVAGAETWANRHVYRTGAAIGAPPDALALKGQDWGIPPQDPLALAAARYHPFRELIEANMRNCGALRVDHVMALFRQWWVPSGFGATDGGYVHYPLEDLVSILALESLRNSCLVIGEDLGTVPDEVRLAMDEFAVHHYKVLLFEKEPDGGFRAPERYARRAVAAATTHDLPTLRGYWEDADLALRDRLQLYPGEDVRQRVRAERALDRVRLHTALVEVGLWPDTAAVPQQSFDLQLAAAVQAYLASSRAALVALQLEDLIGMSDPVNVPGTLDEYPNWQRKLDQGTAAIFGNPAVQQLLAQVHAARQRNGSEPTSRSG